MSIPGAANPLFLSTAAGGAAAGYAIDRSLRFNSADSSYLNRTPSSAGNRKTWTWSGWVKLSSIGTGRSRFFGASGSNTGSPYNFATDIGLNGNKIVFTNAANDIYVTDAVFRDLSAWYHIVVALDTTDSTTANRVKIYVNGVLQDKTYGGHGGAAEPSQNTEYAINTNESHNLGSTPNTSGTATSFFDGYLADVQFIDGQALTPSDFGEYDSDSVWQPKEFAGTYGTNGFHLDFSDGADLGNDSSGANNDWTPNNLVGQLQTGDLGMDVITYTGNASSNTISGLRFAPDFLWLKSRGSAQSHALFDSVRGTGQRLQSDSSSAEDNYSSYFTGFTSDGFTLNQNSGINQNNDALVAWAWKAGGAAVSNTDGTITSQVSANQTHGFSIVSWTGTGAAGSIGHSLNAQPAFVIVKNRDQNISSWDTYHSAIGNTGAVRLNSSSGTLTASDFWNNTSPTSTVFTVSTSGSNNASGQGMIAYCWSEVAGFSKFGSYSGNGSATGPVVTTGFKPRLILIKRTDTTASWVIWDTERANNDTLKPSDAAAEESSYQIDSLSNGFQIKNTWNSLNFSGGTYIYMAFAAGGDGADLDSLLDTPEQRSDQTDTGVGGEVVGNYATWNPLSLPSGSSTSNGNLIFTNSTVGSWKSVSSTMATGTSGKWYCEFTFAAGNLAMFGIASADFNPNTSDSRFWPQSNAYAYYSDNGYTYTSGNGASYGSSYSATDVIGVALDLDNGTLIFYKNGVSQGTAFTGISGSYCFAAARQNHLETITANFGQRAFAYTAPSGYKALCVANLSEPTIADGSQYFDTKVYTGNGGTQNIATSFGPDLVWVKARSAASWNILTDTINGANKSLYSNATTALSNEPNGVSFSGSGFGLGSNSGVNFNGTSYVAWAWDAGSSTVTNTDGSISSQVRANPSAGFSICTFTQPSSSGSFSWGHGLNAAPELVFMKPTSSSGNWQVYHKGAGNAYLWLNSTNAATGTGWGTINSSIVTSTATLWAGNYATVAYCFSSVSGYSAFGSYEGNSSSDGPFVYTGFKPSWILLKNVDDGIRTWDLYDSVRGSYNPVGPYLFPNASSAESDSTRLDILSNGFKLRTTSNGINNQTIIYAAFAEHPFQNSRAR